MYSINIRGYRRVVLGLRAKTNRKNFGITWYMVLETGGVAVGEEVKLDIQTEDVLTNDNKQ